MVDRSLTATLLLVGLLVAVLALSAAANPGISSGGQDVNFAIPIGRACLELRAC